MSQENPPSWIIETSVLPEYTENSVQKRTLALLNIRWDNTGIRANDSKERVIEGKLYDPLRHDDGSHTNLMMLEEDMNAYVEKTMKTGEANRIVKIAIADWLRMLGIEIPDTLKDDPDVQHFLHTEGLMH